MSEDDATSRSRIVQLSELESQRLRQRRLLEQREREVRIKTRLIFLFAMLATWVNLIMLAVALSDDCLRSIG
jgi:hypothetical protein